MVSWLGCWTPQPPNNQTTQLPNHPNMQLVLLHSTPITLFILALYYYWFAVADRYAIFLYNHLGATPFDGITTSRYWMSGLVVSGAVMILYTGALCARALLFRAVRFPDWRRVWALCAIPLAIGIPLITMTQNAPTLPFSIAIVCAIAALLGLTFALMPASLATRHPAELVWLALDGLGIAVVLQFFWAIELPSRLPSVNATMAYSVSFGSIIFAALWLGAIGVARARRNAATPSASALFIAGVCWTYLALPLAHYLFATPPAFQYITAASNFFASNAAMQVLTWLVAAALAFGATRLRQFRQFQPAHSRG